MPYCCYWQPVALCCVVGVVPLETSPERISDTTGILIAVIIVMLIVMVVLVSVIIFIRWYVCACVRVRTRTCVSVYMHVCITASMGHASDGTYTHMPMCTLNVWVPVISWLEEQHL